MLQTQVPPPPPVDQQIRSLPGGELSGRGFIGGHDDVGQYADVRTVKDGGGAKRPAVRVDVLEDGRWTDVVVGREPQPSLAGENGTLPAAAPEDPDLEVGVFAGDHVSGGTIGRPVCVGEKDDDVVDLFGV
jgi:hypothetical protein